MSAYGMKQKLSKLQILWHFKTGSIWAACRLSASGKRHPHLNLAIALKRLSAFPVEPRPRHIPSIVCANFGIDQRVQFRIQ